MIFFNISTNYLWGNLHFLANHLWGNLHPPTNHLRGNLHFPAKKERPARLSLKPGEAPIFTAV